MVLLLGQKYKKRTGIRTVFEIVKSLTSVEYAIILILYQLKYIPNLQFIKLLNLKLKATFFRTCK